MLLLGDIGQVKARFGLFGHCTNLDARLVQGLCCPQFALNVPLALKLFWAHAVELLRDLGEMEARFGVFDAR
jgi:hypothetical protein